jgi:integrase
MPDGRRKCLYGRSRREVLRQLRETRWQLAQGLPVSSRNLHLSDYLEYWLEVTATTVRPSTYENYELNARRINEQLGSVPLVRLSPPGIQSAYGRLHAAGLSAYTVLQAHRTLHRALAHAFHWGLIERNPADLVRPPRPRKREMTALAPDDLRALFEYARGDRLEALWLVLGTGGLRVGEALGLTWEAVDLDGGRVVVKQALKRHRGKGLVVSPLKTPRSYRTVVLTQVALAALRDLNDQVAPPSQPDGELRLPPSGFVFRNTLGGPMDPGFVGYALKRVIREAGLPHVRVHDLRHTAATSLLIAGVHPKIVQDFLGHSSITTTLDTYSHVMPTLHAEAVRLLDRLLRDGGVIRADVIGAA